ncbi:MAG TPA: hypothetical protein PKD15_06220 [Candidatus Saccharibacteria bacterium]|jgi:hypothetical protein|nr:hypothetical protein [Candidatus Saccharibacteria bacterium]
MAEAKFEENYLERMRLAVRTFGTRQEAAKFIVSLSGEEPIEELIEAVQGYPVGDYPANANHVNQLATLASQGNPQESEKRRLASDYIWSQYGGRFDSSPTPMLCLQAEDEYRQELLTRLASGIHALIQPM